MGAWGLLRAVHGSSVVKRVAPASVCVRELLFEQGELGVFSRSQLASKGFAQHHAVAPTTAPTLGETFPVRSRISGKRNSTLHDGALGCLRPRRHWGCDDTESDRFVLGRLVLANGRPYPSESRSNVRLPLGRALIRSA